MNQVFIIGRITRDLEVKFTSTGKAMLRFSVAVDRRKKEDGADFINCVAWGQTAENMDRYLSKGSKVAVLGRIQTGSYEKDGTRINTFDVVADNVEFLDSKSTEPQPKPKAEPEPQFEALDESIPF